MKKLLLFFALTLSLVACTNSYNDLNLEDTIDLVKAPEVIAYSGNTYFGDVETRSSYPNSNMWENVPSNITDEERDKVMDWFSTHQYPESISLDWTDFFVQQLGYSEWECVAEDGFNKYTGKTHMNQLAAGKEGQPDEINNFNSNTAFNAIMKMINSSTENFSYKQSSGNGTRWYDKFVIVCIDGEYYVGFDFVSDGQNPNERVKANGYYNDWIIKITNANPIVNPEPKCDECGHPAHGDVCEDCGDNAGCNQKSETNDPVVTPDTPGIEHNHQNEVEVNLHCTDKGDGLLESHLSIHVRHATDVEVFIPVPMEYYCEADDMAIVQKHDENHMVHGGPYKVEYVLQDKEDGPFMVSLNIEFVENGIRIWTDGINQDVIDFCNKHYGDGITFEVWNYFNDSISLDILKEYLNQSTIKFLDSIPETFINTIVDKDDCTVREDNESY